jgi:hypothetical protein
LSGLRGHDTGSLWQPGAGGLCLHTIILDQNKPDRMYVAISAAGAFRTDDGGTTWLPNQQGVSIWRDTGSRRPGGSLRSQPRNARGATGNFTP